MSNNYPNSRRQINLAEHIGDIEEPQDEEEYTCGPDGEDDNYVQLAYVVCKLKHGKEVAIQRDQLFKTRCTIFGNIFDLIIDSGGTENIILELWLVN